MDVEWDDEEQDAKTLANLQLQSTASAVREAAPTLEKCMARDNGSEAAGCGYSSACAEISHNIVKNGTGQRQHVEEDRNHHSPQKKVWQSTMA